MCNVCSTYLLAHAQDAANGVAAADGSNLAAVGAGVAHEPAQSLPFMEDGACEVREHCCVFFFLSFPAHV